MIKIFRYLGHKAPPSEPLVANSLLPRIPINRPEMDNLSFRVQSVWQDTDDQTQLDAVNLSTATCDLMASVGILRRSGHFDRSTIIDVQGDLRPSGSADGSAVNGKAKMTFSNGKVIFGTFVNGYLREGGSKSPDGNVWYTGQFKNWKFHGKGKWQDLELGRVYEGQFRKGMAHGNGKLVRPSRMYEGQFYCNLEHGTGLLKCETFQYKGQLRKGMLCGFGRLDALHDSLIQQGQFESSRLSNGWMVENGEIFEVKGCYGTPMIDAIMDDLLDVLLSSAIERVVTELRTKPARQQSERPEKEKPFPIKQMRAPGPNKKIKNVKKVEPKNKHIQLIIEEEEKKNQQPCPRCKTYVSRIDDNNHLKCKNCKSDFCFLCLSTLNGHKNQGSNQLHFSKDTCPQHGDKLMN